ncbi:hypothetical protein NKL07_01960 [Mesorhizobium sp. C280B]|uniref:hypothetical protein n=1 Tax=Mesorhizobium sp. C280B TaxID=2956828 RepID=UPI00333A4D0E
MLIGNMILDQRSTGVNTIFRRFFRLLSENQVDHAVHIDAKTESAAGWLGGAVSANRAAKNWGISGNHPEPLLSNFGSPSWATRATTGSANHHQARIPTSCSGVDRGGNLLDEPVEAVGLDIASDLIRSRCLNQHQWPIQGSDLFVD